MANTIEQNLQRMADALEMVAILLSVKSQDVPHHTSPAVDHAAMFAQMPQQLPVAQVTGVSPVLPFPQAGVPSPLTPVPFNDLAGLRSYIIVSYSTMEERGVGQGDRVKNVMTSLGYARADEIPASAYEALYRGVQIVLQS